MTGTDLQIESHAVGVLNVELARAWPGGGINPSTVTRIQQSRHVRAETGEKYRAAIATVVANRRAAQKSAGVAAAALATAGKTLIDAAKVLAGVHASG